MNIPQLYRTIAQKFRSFTSVNEMNESINAHVFAAGRKLHKNARAVLYLLAKHSVMVSGVSWLNPETIANTLGIHERTVNRAYERLESLGIGYRKTVELDGMTLSFFIIRPFVLSIDCPEFVSDLSQPKSGAEPVVPTVEGAFSTDETMEPVEKEKDDDEYIDNAGVRDDNEAHFNIFQTEIYEQAIDNGFERRTALAIASKCEGACVTITAIQNAYTRVLERLDCVSSIPSYFAKVVSDMQTKLNVKRAQKALQMANQAECAGFVPYNWLEEAV